MEIKVNTVSIAALVYMYLGVVFFFHRVAENRICIGSMPDSWGRFPCGGALLVQGGGR